jgi:hypothetical protein
MVLGGKMTLIYNKSEFSPLTHLHIGNQVFRLDTILHAARRDSGDWELRLSWLTEQDTFPYVLQGSDAKEFESFIEHNWPHLALSTV